MTDPVTETPAPSAEERLASLERMRGEIESERTAISREREGMQSLATTLAELVAQSRPAPAPEPAPDIPSEEDFEADRVGSTARLTQAQIREGLRAYDSVRGAEIAEVKSALVEVEWERVRQDDPKNFGRLEATMKAYFTKHPEERRPGAVKEAFVRLRGIHYAKLQEMDRAERQTDTVVDPAPGGQPPRKGKAEPDTFSAQQVKAIRGLGADPRHYFLAATGREPNFEKGYLDSVGLRLQEEPK